MKKHILSLLISLSFLGLWTQAQAQQTVTISGPLTVCVPDTAVLTATASGTPLTYQWFKNGTVFTFPNQQQTSIADAFFQNQGLVFYSVVVDYGGGVTATANFELYVGPPQIFFVNPNTQNNCGPGAHSFFAFTDSLTMGLTPEFGWSFQGPAGAPITATGQNPSVTFTQPGTYAATVVAFLDSACMDTFNFNYTVSSQLQSNATVVNPTCGQADGSITINPSGGNSGVYFVDWSNGQTGLSVSGLAAGTYLAFLSDSGQCFVTDTFTLVEQGNLDYTIDVTNVQCLSDSTGSIDITPTDSSGNISYQWNTGATTQDLNNIAGGVYTLTISDGVCVDTVDIFVDALALDLTLTTTDANCDGTGGGAAVAVTGGTGPYSYLWSNGATTDAINNVALGGYSVVVTDSTGCADQAVGIVDVLDSCTYALSGQAYYDDTQNCIFDGQDFPLGGWISVDGAFSTYTDALGTYQVNVEPGTHVVSFTPFVNIGSFSAICPTSQTHIVNVTTQDITGLDFSMAADTIVRDLKIHINNGPIRPGFNHKYYIFARNNGTVPMNGVVTFTHDALVQYNFSNPAALNYDPTTRTVLWNVTNLYPNQTEFITVHAYLPPSVAIGTLINVKGEVAPVTNDATPADNTYDGIATVVGSFDPNDKQVFPTGEGADGLITESETNLTYTVRFQNTGNFPAEFVIIRDTIDQDINLKSIKPVGASHAYEMRIDEMTRELEITFENIQLPDSASDPEGSQGFFTFDAILQPGLPLGTEIENTAAIYFDFNAPIITNTVKNTIFRPVSVDIEFQGSVKLYPNPTSGFFTLAVEGQEIQSLSVFNAVGQEVLSKDKVLSSTTQLDLSTHAEGIYWVKIETPTATLTRKVMINK